MEYNTQRNKLIIPEYGRNLQKMINDCIAIPDREKRSRTAEYIVEVMAQMNPKVRESMDYRQKLWDHLYIISDFRLDVDSPFPPPERDVLYIKPRRLKYGSRGMRYRHYGKNIEYIIDKACEYPDGPEKDALIRNIANHLKKSYLNWNKGSVDDEVIFQQLSILSQGRLKAGEDLKLHHTNDILARNNPYQGQGQGQGSGQQGGGRKKRFMRPGMQNNGGSNASGGYNYNFKSKRKKDELF